MSAALNARALDTSIQSIGTHPDLSLGSFTSNISLNTPARPGSSNLRVPSSSSQTTAQSSAPISTPSSVGGTFHKRRTTITALDHDESSGSISMTRKLTGMSYDDDFDNGVTDVLETPGKERTKWTGAEDLETPAAGHGTAKRTRSSAGSKGGVNLTLRDQEKHIDQLKKENFNIKLKVHFLEDRLAELAPDQIDAALKQNINLKIEVQQHRMDLKKQKKLILELEQELERMQRADSKTRDLEERLAERERELKELRKRKGGGDGGDARVRELEMLLEERERELKDVRRRKAVGPEDGVVRQLELELDELRDIMEQKDEELDSVRRLLTENNEELERMRDIAERTGSQSFDEEGSNRPDRMRRRVEELEQERAKFEDQKEDYLDEIQMLRLEIENIERKREAESIERSQSRAMIYEEQEGRAAVEDDLNSFRDKYAAVQIELQQKEDDLEMKAREFDDLIHEHDRIIEQVEDECRGEIGEARQQVEDMQDALADKDAESKELRMLVAQLEAQQGEMHEKYETVFGNFEQEGEEKDAEIENANREIEKLGQQVYILEEEIDRLRVESEQIRDEDAVEIERLEALTNALKDKVNELKTELEDMTEMYERANEETTAHRQRQEELARHIEKVVQELQKEREARQRLETEFDSADQEHEAELRRERRALEAKESALQSTLDDLSRTQSLLTQRETDFQAVQSALQSMEQESRKAGETHTTAKFSLQLEVDRLKRDLERLEADLARARKDVDDREHKGRDRDNVLDQLHADNRDLASQLAAQTQARLNLSEKLDDAQGSLRSSESEIATFKSRVQELEQRLSKDQRSLLSAESQYRDQLTERNTLLLTIYQYMDKILGVDKTPKKHGQAETKPFTNFGVFHDNLITRLKALSQIQLDFDKRCKDAEGKFTDRMNDMRKQLESRWRQIDKFETSVKALAEAKASWRKKLSSKEGEVEGLKMTNSDLQAQLASIGRMSGGGTSMEVRALTARATNAERRLINVQNQLAASEEKMSSMNQKTQTADGKWEVRVKEYETRLKAAEEKVKRERQGGKERVGELETALKTLERQNELSKKRVNQLNEIIEVNGLVKTTPPPNLGR